MTTTRGGGFKMLHLEGALLPFFANRIIYLAWPQSPSLVSPATSHTCVSSPHPGLPYSHSNLSTIDVVPNIVTPNVRIVETALSPTSLSDTSAGFR